MNYWERHIGDYARDTAHLSLLEHGVYGVLLDRYYATEEGIPDDQKYRVARARSRDEKAAVDAVLGEFFALVDGFWRNGRADEEIEKARVRISAAQENGRKGGRPKRNPSGLDEKPNGFSLGSGNITQQKAHQTPDTNKTTVPIGTGADAPPTPQEVDPIWHTGLGFLTRKGIHIEQARKFLGKLKREAGDVDTAALLAQAEAEDITDPIPWLSRSAVAARERRARAGPNGQQSMGKMAQGVMSLEEAKNEVRQRLAAAGNPDRPSETLIALAGPYAGR